MDHLLIKELFYYVFFNALLFMWMSEKINERENHVVLWLENYWREQALRSLPCWHGRGVLGCQNKTRLSQAWLWSVRGAGRPQLWELAGA